MALRDSQCTFRSRPCLRINLVIKEIVFSHPACRSLFQRSPGKAFESTKMIFFQLLFVALASAFTFHWLRPTPSHSPHVNIAKGLCARVKYVHCSVNCCFNFMRVHVHSFKLKLTRVLFPRAGLELYASDKLQRVKKGEKLIFRKKTRHRPKCCKWTESTENFSSSHSSKDDQI